MVLKRIWDVRFGINKDKPLNPCLYPYFPNSNRDQVENAMLLRGLKNHPVSKVGVREGYIMLQGFRV